MEHRINYTRSLVDLDKATIGQIKDFKRISSNPQIMKNIGNGKIWSGKDVDKIVFQSKQDAANDNKDYFHWLLLANDNVVGYLSLRPYKTTDLQIRLFVSPSGQGHGSAGIDLVTNEYYNVLGGYKQIWALVKMSNKSSSKIFERNPNWALISIINIYGDNHKEFGYVNEDSD